MPQVLCNKPAAGQSDPGQRYISFVTVHNRSEQIALEGQDLPRTYLARHVLESVIIIIVIYTTGQSDGAAHVVCSDTETVLFAG